MTQILCDAVLFDLDGVLVDSAACVERHWRRWAADHGLDLENVMRLAHGRPTVETIRLVAPHLPAAEEAARLDAGEAFDTDGVMVVDGAVDLVRGLPPGAWAIATSGTRDTAMTRLRHMGVPVPAVLVTADDVTRGKPHPEAYTCSPPPDSTCGPSTASSSRTPPLVSAPHTRQACASSR